MRAHEPKRTAKSTGTAGALLHLKARLWWLQGYPRIAEWISVPAAGQRGVETLAIDATLIRRAAYGLRKLEGEFPRAIARLVPDPKAFFAGARVLLEALKDVVHRGATPAPDLLGRGLFSASAERAVTGLLPPERAAAKRLSWVYATRPRDFGKAVSWLAAGRPDLATDVQLVQVCHLAVAHGARVNGLVRLLAEKRGATVSTVKLEALASALKSLKRGEPPAPLRPPTPELAEKADALLLAALQLDPKRQRRVLRLCNALQISGRFTTWEQFWDRCEREVTRAIGIGKSGGTLVERARRLYEVNGALRKLDGMQPRPIRWQPLFASIARLAEHEGLTRAALALAAAVGDDGSAAIHHAGSAARLAAGNRLDQLARFLRRLAAFFETAGPNRAAISPWRKAMDKQLLNDRSCAYPLDEVLEPSYPTGGIDRVFAALETLVDEYDGAEFSDIAARTVEIFEVIDDLDRGLAFVRALVNLELSGRYESMDVFRAADLIGDPSTFELVIPPLRRIARASSALDVVPIAEALLAVFAGSRPLLHAVLAGGDLSSLIEVGRRIAILRKLKVDVELDLNKGEEEPRWISEFPSALREPLALLAMTREDGREIATAMVGKAIPSRKGLERERHVLRERSQASPPATRARLARRLDNLEERLRAPKPPSEAVLRKLHTKLARRAARELLSLTLDRTDVQLKALLCDLIGVDALPAWVLTPINQRVLFAVLESETPSRKLAVELLRVRCGEEPWDLRDAAPNAAFIASLERRDISMTPWVDGIGKRQHGSMTLCLENDPLEVFLMGHHFGTCLGIGNMNFFSVFANAADINKRVIYARNAQGTVVGRRLVCLSDNGALIAFRSYAHDQLDAFDEASGAFIAELTDAMGAKLAGQASISNLVSSAWYDDGSIDVGRHFDFLADNSAFRRALPTIAPGALGALFEEHAGVRAINAMMAALIARLPEVVDRLTLAAPFVALIENPRGMPPVEAMAIAELLVRAGEVERAAALFSDTAALYIDGMRRQHGWIPADALEFLARVDPGQALRLLKRRYRRRSGSWDEDLAPEQRLVAARCLVELSRTKQAKRVLQRADLGSLNAQLRGQFERLLTSLDS